MIKNVITILVALMVTSVSFAQKTANAPIFKFAEETHDFGNVIEGPDATYEFSFKNDGKEPLIIQSCSASCGCTIPVWPKDPILPGKSGKISVKFSTKGRVGSFNKVVYIQSNAKSDKERYELVIKGVVIPEAKISDNIKMSPSKQ